MSPKKTPKKVLVAMRPQDLPLLSDALGDEFNTVICHTFEEAVAQLDNNVGLIACGVHFAGGRMFDFLHHVNASPQTKTIPFFVILGSRRSYSPAIVHSIEIATKTVGATGFVDMGAIKDSMGIEMAHQWFRATIRTALAA